MSWNQKNGRVEVESASTYVDIFNLLMAQELSGQDDVATERNDAYRVACESAAEIVYVNDPLQAKKYGISINGHSNPDNVQTPGSCADWISIQITKLE